MSHQNRESYNILYFNINSLLNKLDYLKDAIERFERNTGETVHFIALTETKLYKSETRDFKITYYKPFFKSSQDGYGGVALYVHRSLNCSEELSRSSYNVNMLLVRIPSLDINIGVMYKPPAVNNSTFNPILRSFLKYCDENKRGTIIVGDMNIDLMQKNRHREYRDSIDDFDFRILNKINQRSATRIGDTSCTIIDHVLTNYEDLSHNVSIRNTHFSDHRQIHISFD